MRNYKQTMIVVALMATAYVVSVEVTIMNVALPTLASTFSASNAELEWVVDAYNLVLAAFILAAGSLGDRQGRKGALLIGLGVFVSGSLAGFWVETSGALIAARAVMGLGAAIMLPSTLSIVANVFTDRRARSRVIGLWGAATGLGVVSGPVVGGWLLDRYRWGSIFAFLGFVAVAIAVLVIFFVPTSRDPKTPPIDWRGLWLSSLGIGLLVFGLIEVPQWGLSSAWTVGCITIGILDVLVFIAFQRRTKHPMLAISLFSDMSYTVATASITIGFFAMNGFIFLITQYMQQVKFYSALSMGLRILPLGASIGVASIAGAWLGVRISNKLVVTVGLILFSVGLAWASTNTGDTTFITMAAIEILLGLGFGLSASPATESIMGTVSKEKAGVSAAVSDATRLCGATFGVAVIGSMAASLYGHRISSTLSAELPESVRSASGRSLGDALEAAKGIAANGDIEGARQLSATATAAFLHGMQGGSLLAAGTVFASALLTWFLLPDRPRTHDSESATATVAVGLRLTSPQRSG